MEIKLEFDVNFEQEVLIQRAGNRIWARMTIRKSKAEELRLKGGEMVRVAMIKDGSMSVFERKVQKTESRTGVSFRINIPKETVELLDLKDKDTVKVYIKRLS